MQKLDLSYLKDKQREAVETFLRGEDTVEALPTGNGKSLIFAILPYVFGKLRNHYLLKLPFTCFIFLFRLGKRDSSIVVCITPLTSVMLDQHAKFSLK